MADQLTPKGSSLVPLLDDDEINNDEEEHIIETLKKPLNKLSSNKDLFLPSANPAFAEQLNQIDHHLQGRVFKKKFKFKRWKAKWMKFDPDTCTIHYWHSKEDSEKKKPVEIIQISWITSTTISEEDELIQLQIQEYNEKHLSSAMAKSGPSPSDLSVIRIFVYSPNRIYTFGMSTDAEAKKWCDIILQTLELFASEEEKKLKKDVEKKVEPLVRHQFERYYYRQQLLLKNLAESGILDTSPNEKVKEGTMYLEKPDGSFRKYYCILFRDHLAYFQVHDRTSPRGFVALKWIREIIVGPEFQTADESTKVSFCVKTHIRTYKFLAKHKTALMDWVNSLQTVQKNPNLISNEPPRNEEDFTGEPVKLGKVVLEWKEENKVKTYVIKKNNVCIGRSTSCDLILKEPKVSRSHSRIKLNSRNVPIIYDLGSSSGTILNGEKVTQRVLKYGDVIQLGGVTLMFKSK